MKKQMVPDGSAEGTPLISVIVPIYNTEDSLPRCLRSISDSSYPNLEILCVDDGSTDRSGEICDSFAETDARVVVIHKENGGVSLARNAGMRAAKGEYLAFIDSDDWIHEAFFAALMDGIQSLHAEMAMCDFIRTDDPDALPRTRQQAETRLLDGKEMLLQYRTKNFVWRRIYSRSIISGIRFDETLKIEDALFNIQVVANKPDLRVAYIPEPLYAYYIRPGSLVTRLSAEDYQVLAERTCQIAAAAQDRDLGALLAAEAVKRLLSARLDFRLLHKKKQAGECSRQMRQALKLVRAPRGILYRVFAACPSLYGLFRVLDDPTMISYIKETKRNHTAAD